VCEAWGIAQAARKCLERGEGCSEHGFRRSQPLPSAACSKNPGTLTLPTDCTCSAPRRTNSAPDAKGGLAAAAAEAVCSTHESRAALKREHAVRNGRPRRGWLAPCHESFPERPPAAGALPAGARALALAQHEPAWGHAPATQYLHSPPRRTLKHTRSAPGALSDMADAAHYAGTPPRTVHCVHPVSWGSPVSSSPPGAGAGARERPPLRRQQGWLPTIRSISEAPGAKPRDDGCGAFAVPPAPQVTTA